MSFVLAGGVAKRINFWGKGRKNMNEQLKIVKEKWNVTADSQWYNSLRTDEKINELVEHPETAFHPEVYSLIKKYLPDIKGKKILLPSSGDNHAAFAFAIMGADVTSRY